MKERCFTASKTWRGGYRVDIAANTVAAGNARAKKARLENCRFFDCDATNLEQPEANMFDLVASIFGAK